MTIRPTVFVIDDDEPVRFSLQMLLESCGYDAVTFSTAEEFLHQLRPDRLGCVLLDVRLGAMSGLELQAELRRIQRRIPVIVMSGYADVRVVVQAMQSGAVDFLEKPVEEVQLIAVVARALEKHSAIREVETRLEALTPRENQVMHRLIEGRSVVQIAEELGISRKTVDVHRGRVLQKALVKNVAELGSLVHRLDA